MYGMEQRVLLRHDCSMEAQATGRLVRRLAVLTHPSLLVVDEIGYLPINHGGAVPFFQLMNRRYERASTVLTSNKGFEEWGHIFGDDVMAAALIDRVLHHCHLVNVRGNSYRGAGQAFAQVKSWSLKRNHGVQFSAARTVLFSPGVDSQERPCSGSSQQRYY